MPHPMIVRRFSFVRRSHVCRLALACVGMTFVSTSLSAAEANPSPATASTRPNIVLIVTDDMGYGDCSSYWNTDLQTPFIDEIARNGIRFTQFRVNPLCSPTRSSLITQLFY